MASDEAMKAQVEKLAAKFHNIYQAEAKRQGDVRHIDAYDDLPENIKEFDRVLAREVLCMLAQAKMEEHKNPCSMCIVGMRKCPRVADLERQAGGGGMASEEAVKALQGLQKIAPFTAGFDQDDRPLLNGTLYAYAQGALIPVLTEEQIALVAPVLDRMMAQARADATEQCAIEAGERSSEGVSSHTMLGDMWDERILRDRQGACFLCSKRGRRGMRRRERGNRAFDSSG